MSICICFVVISTIGFTQNEYQIETSDIDNFWKAYDSLKNASSKSDSIKFIQELYIDKATPEFKEFIRIRNFTSEEYIMKIKLYPNFWKTIRTNTEQIKYKTSEIIGVFETLKKELPNFKNPKICFVIGCLRTGGTISKDLILIGSEIASASDSVDISELSKWLKSVVGKTGDISSMIAHETIHTQQINKKKIKLLTGVMNEGIADFITSKLLGKNINKSIFEYGLKNECDLKAEFFNDLKSNPKDYSKWIYNGGRSKDRPSDLGYFIGYRIAEAYYEKQSNKKEALANLLNHKKYKNIFRESNYFGKGCN